MKSIKYHGKCVKHPMLGQRTKYDPIQSLGAILATEHCITAM